jgi:superfamily II DNA helicase RecQ
MQLKFFTIPLHAAEPAAGDLNTFLAATRILAIDRQFVADGANSAWAVCVTFDQGLAAPAAGRAASAAARRGKVDFKDILSDPEFAVFARLRARRKELADAEGVPAYALFTNEQLAEMVQRRVLSATELRAIAGVGESRVDKYGGDFLRILAEAALPAEAAPAL